MQRSERYRRVVVARAGGACEYCRLIEEGTGVIFHLDHVVPLDRGGSTTLGNLALCCPGCNLAKGNQVRARDASNRWQPLYNPRGYEPSILGWHLHFQIDRSTGLIAAVTPVGEATLRALQMNEPRRTFARRLQLSAGLWS